MRMNPMPKRSRIGIAVLACAGAGVLAPLAGCNITGPAYYLIHGPEKIPKEYQLDPKRPTVVFVDDPGNRIPKRQLRAVMGQTVEEVLLEKGLLKSDKKSNNMISSGAALTVAGKDKSEAPMSITQIGRAVGADVVIWVMVDRFTLSPDGQSMSPTVSVRMKIIDTVEDKRLWPDDPAGKPFTFVAPAASASLPETTSARAQAELNLAEYAGRGISELFYNVERPTAVRAGKK
jgi:hypothetical protein